MAPFCEGIPLYTARHMRRDALEHQPLETVGVVFHTSLRLHQEAPAPCKPSGATVPHRPRQDGPSARTWGDRVTPSFRPFGEVFDAQGASQACDCFLSNPETGVVPGVSPRPQCAFKVSMFNVPCNSHHVTHFAALFIDARAK